MSASRNASAQAVAARTTAIKAYANRRRAVKRIIAPETWGTFDRSMSTSGLSRAPSAGDRCHRFSYVGPAGREEQNRVAGTSRWRHRSERFEWVARHKQTVK